MQGSGYDLSHNQKILMLRQRYRSTKDLWLYMSHKRKSDPPPSLADPCISRLPDAAAQDYKTAVHSADPVQPEEGATAERCSYTHSAAVALACSQVCLPSDSAAAARDH